MCLADSKCTTVEKGLFHFEFQQFFVDSTLCVISTADDDVLAELRRC